MSGIIGVSPDMRSGVVGAWPKGHIIQIVGDTDNTPRSIVQPDNIGVEGVRKTITSTVANSNFIIMTTVSTQVENGHGAVGICLNGLSLQSNLIYTASHADGSGTGDQGWYGNKPASPTNTYRLINSSNFFYNAGNHSVGTSFTFYACGMGFHNLAATSTIYINIDSERNGTSSIVIQEIAP